MEMDAYQVRPVDCLQHRLTTRGLGGKTAVQQFLIGRENLKKPRCEHEEDLEP